MPGLRYKRPRLYMRGDVWWVSYKNRRWSTRCSNRDDAERMVERAIPDASATSEATAIIRRMRDNEALRVAVLRAFQPRPAMGTIYFVLAVDSGFVKIGYTTDLPQRLDQMRVHNASELRVLLTVPGKSRLESEMHARWRRLRVRGEWYRHEGELAAFIKENSRSPNVQRELMEMTAGGQLE